jgi:hypothetical protein
MRFDDVADGRQMVATEARARAILEGFEVSGDLFGHAHLFEHNRRSVRVEIPTVALGADLRPLAAYDDVAALRRSHAVDPRPETTSYEVAWIEISISVQEQIVAPDKLMEMPPKHPDVAGKRLAKRLDKLVIEYEAHIARALHHWEEVVRWISGSSALGSPNVVLGRSSASRLDFMSLVRASDHHRFWTPTHVLSILRSTTVDASVWRAIGSALAAGHEAPIWFRYLDEAFHRRIGRDLSGAVLSSAIACETIAREIFWIAGGASKREAIRDLIDRVSIRAILSRWADLTGISKSDAHIAEVGRLFTLRNRLMHAGAKGTELEESGVQHLLGAARIFVQKGDEWYHHQLGRTNPRLLRASP